MAAYLDKERINTAIDGGCKLDLSHVHITTADFMQLQPIYAKEMVPGEKLDVNVETFSRMNPLPVPTFGRGNIKNRAYFVPFRTIFRGWNDFITDAPHTPSDGNTASAGANLSRVPILSNYNLIQALTNVQYVCATGINYSSVGRWSYGAVAAVSPNVPDFVLKKSDNTTVNMRFTDVGRDIMKVLESLGYKINWNENDDSIYSALPLMAFAKVYMDWYFPSAYTSTVEYQYVMLKLNQDTGTAGVSLDKVDIGRMLQMVYTCYDSDYFVSAWDNPVAPNDAQYTTFSVPDITVVTPTSFYGNSSGFYAPYSSNTNNITNLGVTTGSNTYGTPTTSMKVMSSGTGGVRLGMSISQYQHTALTKLTDYMKRHQLAGSRAMDRYLARFGKALKADQLNRSVYLGCQTVPLQFGDVMSNAATEQGYIGEYAGKGIAYDDKGSFTCSTDEFGMFIIVSTITPATGYYQGVDRSVKHIYHLDYWTPEFDGLGTQPITADELYVTYAGDSSLADPALRETIFGFTPRYAEYKVGRDQVTGNFRVPSLHVTPLSNNGSASWHLMRSFDDTDFATYDSSGNAIYSVDNIKHNVNFVYARGDNDQYNRIFVDASSYGVPDNFVVVHNFEIGSYVPMKPLYDSYEFDDKGKKATLDVNGVKHN